MPKSTLTAASVKAIKVPAAGQVDHFDAGYPGLALRVSHGGAKAWVHFYRIGGKQRRRTLGRYINDDDGMTLAKAHAAWRADRALIEAGTDPVAHVEPDESRDAVSTVIAEWLKRDQGENRSAGEVKRVLEKDVLPKWKGRTIETITRRDVIEVLDGIVDRGAPTLARRTHSYLHRFFRWCVGRDIIAANPMADLPKSGAETSRDRVLSDDELARVWRAAGGLGYPFGPAIRELILTGARRDEIGSLQRHELDGGTIRLEGERTKNGEPHTIPLPGLARRIIENLPKIGANGTFVFTTTGDTAVSGWSKAKRALDRAAGVDPWRIHDLRRTCATGMQRLGIPLQVVEAVLNHISGSRAGVVGIYQRHGFEDEKREALAAWARYVALLARPRTWAKVREHVGAIDVAKAKRDDVSREREREMLDLCRKGGTAWTAYVRGIARPASASNVVALHG